jgi:anti-anti-sigma factor
MDLFRTYQQKAFLVIEFNTAMLFGQEVIKDVQPQLYVLIEEKGHNKLVLDLAKVKEMSSQFIGLVVAIHTRLSKRGGKLVVCGLNPKLSELLAMTRLDRMITVLPTVRDAVERDVFLG